MITVSSAGTYTVTGTDANGCSNTATKTVSVNPTYNIPLAHSICQGESYNFYGQNLTAAGTYTHTLQTVNGCDSVLTLTLTVKALPTPAITGNTSLCQGQTTTLTANGGVSYLWSNASTNNSINVTQSGVYTVTATNVEGCSDHHYGFRCRHLQLEYGRQHRLRHYQCLRRLHGDRHQRNGL